VTDSDGGIPEQPQAKLARKLNLLLDLFEAQGSSPLTYPQISKHMSDRGTPLSRSRWAYMRAGDSSMATDPQLLKNLAEFFGVDPGYLLDDDGEVPDLVDAQLELLRTLRENRVRNFAARQLQGISPETLLRLRKAIDERLKAPEDDADA
jgi:transcriptional regulator with XRE-family HTH domain